MKRLLLIYNPVSGKGSFKNKLDYVIDTLQKDNFTVTSYRLSANENLEQTFNNISIENFDSIVAAGGDGTINTVASALVHHELDIPLGIIPVGTSNDFANHLGIKRRIDRSLETIVKGQYKYVDIGLINGKHFVNVVSAGNIASIAHNTNITVKNNLGKLGYYINVLGQNPVFNSFKLRLYADGIEYNEDAMLFFVLNSPCAGGFKNLGPNAKVDDGKFDVLVFKNCKPFEKLSLFLKVLKGEHHSDDCALYFQTHRLVVECDDVVETDIDGEKGPNFPLEINYLKKIKVYC